MNLIEQLIFESKDTNKNLRKVSESDGWNDEEDLKIEVVYANTLKGLRDKVDYLIDKYGDTKFAGAALQISVVDGEVRLTLKPGWQNKEL